MKLWRQSLSGFSFHMVDKKENFNIQAEAPSGLKSLTHSTVRINEKIPTFLDETKCRAKNSTFVQRGHVRVYPAHP